ncbi:ABC transporter ATP-binding protein [Paenibacillus doosanensis]|uniref:Spermidine/putrescine import ATP-binding protein PotA n=1 Tax=Paenibacillus konkukensis TaxID=2020716 RepID=A0ABY4RI00_9BACL|nr:MULTISPECIES: ABC transporter ATP-binding protein [Paenibacillus]MCS7463840.1 ABC transporter ATP-binding protein [Paenibacillus doosanensis]UQZ81148.1 Spermidine/putrescine import ATP-binding protein PotA [Paenibacillus konkukensis]
MDVVIQGLQKSFDDVQALHATDLRIRQGRFTTLLGPSGCGKTTLLRMIAGLETPDQGEIAVGDECMYSSARRIEQPAHRRGFGMVFQDFALWPHMTVFENVAFGLRASGKTKDLKRQVQEAVDQVRLGGMEDRYPHQLSGGQQQRVAFARAVVTKPRLVLFDEPLSALDAMLRDEMRLELISLVRDIGLTALYVTHDQTEAMSMSDEIVVMKQGRILQIGRPEDIYGAPEHPFVAQFIGKSNWLAKDRSLVRPEHIRWRPEDEAEDKEQRYTGTIRSVSYLGDRYEVQLDMGELGLWTAYHQRRLPHGEQANLYVSEKHIHHIS